VNTANELLVVEDDPDIRQALGDIFAAAGYAVHTVATLVDARVALMRADFRLMVLDLGLPDGHGTFILRELRGRGNMMPVLICTGEQGSAADALDAGADAVVSKPFSGREILARVRALSRLASPAAMASSVCVAA
jgi:DNA-binding response OmpR family regulator